MSRVRFKDYLNDYLECYHITNKEFASRLGISQKHLIDILSGKQGLSADVISTARGVPRAKDVSRCESVSVVKL